MAKRKLSFKESLQEVEGTIQRIEGNELEIDQLFEEVKRSAQLLKECKDTLYKTQTDLNAFFDTFEKES